MHLAIARESTLDALKDPCTKLELVQREDRAWLQEHCSRAMDSLALGWDVSNLMTCFRESLLMLIPTGLSRVLTGQEEFNARRLESMVGGE